MFNGKMTAVTFSYDDSEIIRQVEQDRLALSQLDIRNEWDRFEELCKLISGKDDIFYGTNREVLLP